MSYYDPPAPARATLNYDEAATYLGISARTLKRLVADGRVRSVHPADRRTAFLRPDLDDYLQSVARGGTPRRKRSFR